MSPDFLRRLEGEPKVWRALGHPLRNQMRELLAQQGPATSTSIAKALGLTTGTTSYHLRQLADAGLIEDDPDRPSGRERWWRAIRIDHREPPYADLGSGQRAALDRLRRGQLLDDVELFARFGSQARAHREWAKISRGRGWFTQDGLQAFMDAYVELLAAHSTTKQDAPGDAHEMDVRMYFLPRND